MLDCARNMADRLYVQVCIVRIDLLDRLAGVVPERYGRHGIGSILRRT